LVALNSLKKAAKSLDISVWTLRRMAYQGKIASVKIGGKLQIPEQALEEIVQAGYRPRHVPDVAPQAEPRQRMNKARVNQHAL
jgi:excisionase family DNA binding protein